MTITTTIQSLPLLSPSQAQKTVTHNQAIAQLDAMVQLAVKDRDQTAPPATPATGDVHLVAAGATGAWAGMDNQVAVWNGTAWEYHQPLTGWRAYVTSEQAVAAYSGTTWQTSSQLPQFFPRVGVNTAADATNRLAVKSDASLFEADTASHQLKINKTAAGDTASAVFQQGFASHAEIGLVGSNDLSVKVSADGTSFTEAFAVESASGKLVAMEGINFSPAATDPATSVDGDLWYNSTSNTFRARQGGVTVDLGSGGGGSSSGLFLSSAFTLQDSTDASKQAQFDLSALPAAATQSYGLPPMSSTLAVHGFFATRADALAWMAGEAMPDGTIVSVSGLAFRKATAAGVIADMPDWVPALEVYADHFAENGTPGTTDMTAAIQGALDYVSALGGGVVKLLQGTYAAAGLSMDNQIYLVGQGIEATTLKLKDGANTWLVATSNYVQNTTYANYYGGMRDLTLDGNNAKNPTGSLAWFASYRAQFFRVRFANSGGSGLVLTAIMSDGTTLLGNNMAENEVRNCHFDKNALHGLHANDGAANKVSDVEVMHCHMNSNGGSGIYAERCSGWKITHNQIYASGTHCIFVDELARSVIAGNHLDLRPLGAAAGSRNACVYVNGISTQGAWVVADNIFLMDGAADSSTVVMNGLAVMSGSADPAMVGANTYVDLTTAQAAEEVFIAWSAQTSLGAVKWAVAAEGPGQVLHRNETDLVLEDSADPTKQGIFSLSGITSGAVRTYAMPDGSGTLALDGVFGTASAGLVPASGGGTASFLRGDGTWTDLQPTFDAKVDLPSYGILTADHALANSTALQKAFDWSANGALTLAAGVYQFQVEMVVAGMSATDGNLTFDLRGAGTAVLGKLMYHTSGGDTSNPGLPYATSGLAAEASSSGGNAVVTATGAALRLEASGMFMVATGGTLIPSVALASASAAVVKAGSFFRCMQVGTGYTSAGWS